MRGEQVPLAALRRAPVAHRTRVGETNMPEGRDARRKRPRPKSCAGLTLLQGRGVGHVRDVLVAADLRQGDAAFGDLVLDPHKGDGDTASVGEGAARVAEVLERRLEARVQEERLHRLALGDAHGAGVVLRLRGAEGDDGLSPADGRDHDPVQPHRRAGGAGTEHRATRPIAIGGALQPQRARDRHQGEREVARARQVNDDALGGDEVEFARLLEVAAQHLDRVQEVDVDMEEPLEDGDDTEHLVASRVDGDLVAFRRAPHLHARGGRRLAPGHAQ